METESTTPWTKKAKKLAGLLLTPFVCLVLIWGICAWELSRESSEESTSHQPDAPRIVPEPEEIAHEFDPATPAIDWNAGTGEPPALTGNPPAHAPAPPSKAPTADPGQPVAFPKKVPADPMHRR